MSSWGEVTAGRHHGAFKVRLPTFGKGPGVEKSLLFTLCVVRDVFRRFANFLYRDWIHAALINEAVNLVSEWGRWRLEQRSGRVDHDPGY